LVPDLSTLYNDQDLDKLRFSRPIKSLFLCGGPISTTATSKAFSLRDYLYRRRHIQKDINAEIVLAETATQLYRDTEYKDLISFEEDVARIASVVLVITESPGALAELGAFATNDTIRNVLRIVMQERFFAEESFIRFGPIERVMNEDRGFIGTYPWRVNGDHLVIRSAAPHYEEIVNFINDHLRSVPSSTTLPKDGSLHLFYITYWIIYILVAVSTTTLYKSVIALLPSARQHDIKNKLYCMQLVGWIKKIPYSGKDYYSTTIDEDPFNYSFRSGPLVRDSIRRKTDIARAMKSIEDLPKAVLTAAAAGRRPK
jgi:hypothetical protein